MFGAPSMLPRMRIGCTKLYENNERTVRHLPLSKPRLDHFGTLTKPSEQLCDLTWFTEQVPALASRRSSGGQTGGDTVFFAPPLVHIRWSRKLGVDDMDGYAGGVQVRASRARYRLNFRQTLCSPIRCCRMIPRLPWCMAMAMEPTPPIPP